MDDILFTNHSEASGGHVRPLAGLSHTCHVCAKEQIQVLWKNGMCHDFRCKYK